MAYDMTIRLTDQEYAALSAEAARQGKQPETLLHDVVQQRFQPASQANRRPLSADEFEEKLYREGLIEHMATRQPVTPEEQAELERLGQVFSGGKPMSEMVIEDRGPS